MDDHELLRLLVASVFDYGIFMLSPEGIVMSWNDGAQRIKGYAANEIIGQPFTLFYTEDDIQKNKPAYELKQAAAVGRFEAQSSKYFHGHKACRSGSARDKKRN